MSWQLACTNTNTVGYRMMITLFLTPWTTTKQREIRQFTVMERVKEQNQNPKQPPPKTQQNLMTGTKEMLATYSLPRELDYELGCCSSSISKINSFSLGLDMLESTCASHDMFHVPSKHCMLLVQICTRAECDKAGKNKDIRVRILSH